MGSKAVGSLSLELHFHFLLWLVGCFALIGCLLALECVESETEKMKIRMRKNTPSVPE